MCGFNMIISHHILSFMLVIESLHYTASYIWYFTTYVRDNTTYVRNNLLCTYVLLLRTYVILTRTYVINIFFYHVPSRASYERLRGHNIWKLGSIIAKWPKSDLGRFSRESIVTYVVFAEKMLWLKSFLPGKNLLNFFHNFLCPFLYRVFHYLKDALSKDMLVFRLWCIFQNLDLT